jgi:carboxypeptidase C (cathepsin A)
VAGTAASSLLSGDPSASLASAADAAVVTHHQITLNGQSLAYTATAGNLNAEDLASGAPEASIFYVAYTADGADPATRPITFFYNGGPGSASLWLHLGSFGPKRLVTGDPATTQTTPFPLVDNADCLLDTTDMVFVDPVGTGFSEAIAPHTNQSYWGVDSDAAVLRDFIIRFLATTHRQASPTYLFGESYGTPRTAVLANKLEAAGTPLTGLILQSSILDYNANGDMTGGSNATFFPSFAMTGAYFGLDQPKPTDLGVFAQQMDAFTDATWSPALASFLSSGIPLEASLASQLADNTGIPPATWTSTPNVSESGFRQVLVAGSLLGRYDARVSAPLGSWLAADGDPSDTLIAAPFAEAMSAYLPSFLGIHSPSVYLAGNDATIQDWDFTHNGRQLPDTIPDLASALALNPHLKILSLNGYEDLATPFHQTELDLARLGSQPNLTIRHYHGGHMTYLDDVSRPLEKQDLRAFYGIPATLIQGTSSPVAPETVPLATRVPPQRVAMGHRRGPWVPARLRNQPRTPPFSGTALQRQVIEGLRARFDRADRVHAGFLTKAEAREDGFGFVALHFDQIDVRHVGRISFQDLEAFLHARAGKP